jgi:hypothetical protein
MSDTETARVDLVAPDFVAPELPVERIEGLTITPDMIGGGAVDQVLSSRENAVNALLDDWVAESLANSPVSRVTEAWNYLATTALPALRVRLLAGF